MNVLFQPIDIVSQITVFEASKNLPQVLSFEIQLNPFMYERKKLKNDQIYFKDLAVFMQLDFSSMLDHFSSLCMKGLTH